MLYAWLLERVVAARAPLITIPGGLRKGPAVFINLPDGAADGDEAGGGAHLGSPPGERREETASQCRAYY